MAVRLWGSTDPAPATPPPSPAAVAAPADAANAVATAGTLDAAIATATPPPDARLVVAAPPDAAAARRPTDTSASTARNPPPTPSKTPAATPGPQPSSQGRPSLVGTPPITDPEAKGPSFIDNPGPLVGFDLVAWLPQARRLARKEYDDAELVMMYASGIGTDGKGDLTQRTRASYLFRSPRRSGPERRCYYRLDLAGKKIEVGPILPATTSDACKWPIAPVPRCTMQKVWKEAIGLGVDPNARAYVRYTVYQGQARWEFTVLGGPQEFQFADDC